MGAAALKRGEYARAAKLFGKSLQLYPLPGVEAMLSAARARANDGGNQQNNSAAANSNANSNDIDETTTTAPGPTTPRSAPERSTSTASNATNDSQSGRSFTPEHVRIIKHILEAKKGGRGAHYRVLGVSENASDSDLKKAYR